MQRILILIAALSLTACGFEQVDTGHRGVQIRYGKVDEQIGSMSEGLYFYNPITSNIIEMDVRTQRWEGVANTYTRDVQQANIKFVVNYRLRPDKVHITYRDVGRGWADVLLPQAVEGELKKVIGNYEAVALIDHRAEATRKTQEAIAIFSKDSRLGDFPAGCCSARYVKNFESAHAGFKYLAVACQSARAGVGGRVSSSA